MGNPIIYDASVNVGRMSAEADEEFLFECFFDHPSLSEMKDVNSSKMFILGSTGIGKTAFLKMIEKSTDSIHNVELDEISMSYISNSTIISFLAALDVPLDRFFQALWKHVICIEYIRLKYKVGSRDKSKSIWQRLANSFGHDDTRAKALKYLEKYDQYFWVTVDESIKEVVENLEREVSIGFAAEVDKFSTDAGFVRKLGVEKRTHLKQRLQKIVDADLLTELSQVIRLLSDDNNGSPNVTFVLVDRLDEGWVDSKLKYGLVRAMVEALKGLRRINSLKVVVAMRSDLMEKVIYETKEQGFQSEKYEDYMLRLKWSSEQLKSLVNKRINFLFRKKYNSDNVFFEDIFPSKVRKENCFPYLIDRTLLRPRDVINFVNMIFEQAEGKSKINETVITAAEKYYSEERRKALIDEWRGVFPGLEPILRILEGKRASFNLSELNTSDLPNDLMTYFFEKEEFQNDELWKSLEIATSTNGDFKAQEVLSKIMQRLYLVGAIGINTKPELPLQWFYKSQKQIAISAITPSSKIRVHKMLHSSLNIR